MEIRITTMTIEKIKECIKTTDWDFLADDLCETGESRCLVSVICAEADECLTALKKALPKGVHAFFNGTGNTDAHGDTTEDIEIRWDNLHYELTAWNNGDLSKTAPSQIEDPENILADARIYEEGNYDCSVEVAKARSQNAIDAYCETKGAEAY